MFGIAFCWLIGGEHIVRLPRHVPCPMGSAHVKGMGLNDEKGGGAQSATPVYNHSYLLRQSSTVLKQP